VDLDVTKPNQASSAVNEIIANEGHLDVLVNNAGHGSMGITEDFTSEFVRTQFETNVLGVFNTTKAVIPVMKKAGKGLVITISSGLGRMVIPTLSVYCASKFAVEALAEGWRYELAPLGIDSVIVEPGAFPTTNFMAAAYANSPQPSGKIADYHGLKDFVEGFGASIQESIKNGTANNPQDVADAVENLIEMPHDNRPLRTVVDKMYGQILNPLNKSTDEIEFNMLHAFQLA
jgi:NAD(P)-dependent dehydrogenase (short-subunit alcohol dehydrogenase family)